MPKSFFSKILNYRLPSLAAGFILVIVFLFSAYQVNVKAAGMLVFAGRVSAHIPMSVCANQYTCSSCTLCGCGTWDQKIIAPIFGRTINSSYYVCQQPAYVPMGTGNLMMGSVVLGSCTTNYLSTYNPIACNIWSQWQ
jgi:hypothetical protein